MEIQTRGIGADTVATAAEQAVKGQASLLGGQIPQGDLQRLVKRQGIAALVAATRARNAVDEADGRLTLHARPDLGREDAFDLGLIGQWGEQGLDETQTNLPGGRYQFQRRAIDVICAYLTVANHAISCKLETCNAKLD